MSRYVAPFSPAQYHDHTLVYRRYAGLYFCACIDADDNELAYLEAIHLFVEILDAYFENVCELDLVFYFYQVRAVLDEVFLAGEIQETSKSDVLARLEQCTSQMLMQWGGSASYGQTPGAHGMSAFRCVAINLRGGSARAQTRS